MLVGITHPYRAWCFDEACMAWGSAVEEAMATARNSGGKKSKATPEQKEAKADNAMRRMLGIKPKFRDIRMAGGVSLPPADRPDPPFEMEQ